MVLCWYLLALLGIFWEATMYLRLPATDSCHADITSGDCHLAGRKLAGTLLALYRSYWQLWHLSNFAGTKSNFTALWVSLELVTFQTLLALSRTSGTYVSPSTSMTSGPIVNPKHATRSPNFPLQPMYFKSVDI
ncbi:uncharacterized protein PSFLO_02843 [Pseudozyma flocculosa]|uniref:Uncharacterized protein n=1 Tax=Pseudozyma flocculosa TaxID=84751 RepID=A0A5C3EZT8_9BASI|nr:uncharacterized protein PSFLO_02843 [Pseudozyma flocculosa]